ncbi:hypothetical protein [Paenibacillus roseus]
MKDGQPDPGKGECRSCCSRIRKQVVEENRSARRSSLLQADGSSGAEETAARPWNQAGGLLCHH